MEQINTYDIEAQVLDAMRAHDSAPAETLPLVLDGQIHRYRVHGDKASEKSGSYCIHTDGWPAGWFMDWHNGEAIIWKFNGEGKFTRDFFESPEYKEMLRLSDEHQKQLRAEREAAQKKAILKAREEWNSSAEIEGIPTFPYLLQKHVNAYGIRLRLNLNSLMYGHGDKNGLLVIPLRNINGEIQTLQYIDEQGGKRFFTDAPVKGAFFSIALDERFLNEHPAMPILLCEGYATAVTVYQGIYNPVVAAMTAGNLLPVAEALKGKYPGHPIIIMADNDRHADGRNTGLEKAREAVRKLDLQGIIYPEFTPEEEGSDWNDYAAIHGVVETVHLLRAKIDYECMSEAQKAEYNIRAKLAEAFYELDPNVQLPPQEFIGGIFPRGFVSLLIAPPGTGKTIFMQKFCSDLSLGGNIFDGFAEDEPVRKSLILAGEAGYELLVRRAASLKWKVDKKNVIVLDQYKAETLGLDVMFDSKEGLDNVKKMIDMFSPDILFVDTFSSFHESDENKAPDMKPIIKMLASYAREYNIAIVLVHHSRKRLAKERSLSLNQDDSIGSSIMNRLVGLIIGIEPLKDNEGVLLVRPLKSWFRAFSPFTYTLKEGLYGETIVQTDLAPANVNNSKAAVSFYLSQNFGTGEWFSFSQIILSEIEGNVTEWQLRRVLYDFVKTGKLLRRGNSRNIEYSIA